MASNKKPKSPNGDKAAADKPAKKVKAPAKLKGKENAKGKQPVKSKAAGDQPNLFQQASQFLREVKTELKKVAWPSRKQTVSSTVVVVVLVLVIAAFLGTVDFLLSHAIRLIIG